MTRLVFRLAGSLDARKRRRIEISIEEPSVLDSMAQPFRCTGREQAFIDLRDVKFRDKVTKQAGTVLFDEVTKHEDIKAYLTTALQTQRPNRYPVFVKLETAAGVEALPWEALCSSRGEFLSLDERWAVGRLVGSLAVSSSLWHFTPPLRIAAVLSCLNVEAVHEWNALKAAFKKTPGIKVDVLVIVSEPQLYDDLVALADAKAAGSPLIHPEMVPRELSELQEMVRQFGPHLLHLFCHGSAQEGPHLEVAVKSDRICGRSESSLTVEAREFKDFFNPSDDPPWLTVLNCCETAKQGPEDNAHSLALSLVNEVGLPAVVGMREPVASNDASVFTKAFYTRLLRDLQARTDDGSRVDDPLDWAMMLVPARAELARTHGQNRLARGSTCTKQWTLPVVYMRSKEIMFQPILEPAGVATVVRPPGQRSASKRRTRLEIEALRGLLTHLPPNAPLDLRVEAEAQWRVLMNELEEE